MLQLIMVLVSFLLSDAIPGLTILHEDQSADKERERENKRMNGGTQPALSIVPRLPRSQVESGTCEDV
jgi:hypothetical protein